MTKFTRLFAEKRKERFVEQKQNRKFKISPAKISVTIFLALILTGFAYLAVINNVSTGGFEIKKLEQQIATLKENNQKLQLEAASLQSMSVIQAASAKMSLSQAKNIDYLEVTPPVVALGQ